MNLGTVAYYFLFFFIALTKTAHSGVDISAFQNHRVLLDGLIAYANTIRSDSRDSRHLVLQQRTNDLLTTLIQEFGSNVMPASLIRSTVERYLSQPLSVSSIDKHPKISLALALLNNLEYCSGVTRTNKMCSSVQSGYISRSWGEAWNWSERSEVAQHPCNLARQEKLENSKNNSGSKDDGHTVNNSSGVFHKSGLDDRTRIKSQLPLLRVDAARRVIALVAEANALSRGEHLTAKETIPLAFGEM